MSIRDAKLCLIGFTIGIIATRIALYLVLHL